MTERCQQGDSGNFKRKILFANIIIYKNNRMNLKQLHTTLLITLCAALAACSDQDVLVDNSTASGLDNGKTPIALSVGGVDAPSLTRAVITNDPDKTYHPFNKDTKIFMVMKSTYGTEDYQGSRKDKYTVSRGEVKASSIAITFDNLNQKYWDDAHARSSQLDIWAYAAMVPSSWNSCTFQIPSSTWEPQTPETAEHKMLEYISKTYETNTQAADKSPYPWIEHSAGDKGSRGAIYPCIMEWKVTNTPWTQTEASIQYQDLMFSNNLADNTSYEGSDNRLKFGTQTVGKFDTGEMKFYHAMSKITIHIIEGDGFDKTSANKEKDFQFKSETNVKFPQDVFNTQGTFNIKNGYFEKVDNHNEITKIALTSPKGTDPEPYYTLQALAIPNINGINGQTDNYSRFVPNDTKVMMEFTIDNNTYKITSGDLYTALHEKIGATEKTDNGTYIPLEAGKNYVFTFKVSKSKVSGITAQLAPWEEVTAATQEPSNARISLKLEERGGNLTENANMYRAADNPSSIVDDYESYNWKTGYTDENVYKYGEKELTNLWLWPNNMTYYHIRAIMPTTSDVTTDAGGGDYTALQSGSVTSSNDVCWGAPMLDVADNESEDDFKWTYDAKSATPKGFGVTNSALGDKNQIFHAIGPTNSTIKLILFHMMSQVKFVINTTNGADAVDLGDGTTDAKKTTIEILDHYNKGKVLLGNGLVQTTGSKQDVATLDKIWKADSKNSCQYAVVPQDLTGVKLRITTPDNNRYIVDLNDVKATTVTNYNIANPYTKGSDNKYIIDRWYPGFQYTYTFTLSKKKIESITATILGWENVTAGDDNVQIK